MAEITPNNETIEADDIRPASWGFDSDSFSEFIINVPISMTLIWQGGYSKAVSLLVRFYSGIGITFQGSVQFRHSQDALCVYIHTIQGYIFVCFQVKTA
ncbi:unnamed protein product [Fusarium venenatum]|uniref:Uncharacterized protein n=1 Tax=Fusarium venenatum TaxID=56646 RepID=A0A2L2TFZ8_9HYPO|nr:uncharacterized protein FVRRES_09095 [Fusarium venenatum]CEI69018.1 unnamed protein product [Fusarium venenatum]